MLMFVSKRELTVAYDCKKLEQATGEMGMCILNYVKNVQGWSKLGY